MRAILPYHEILDNRDGHDILRMIELCGRVYYKSEDKITDSSAKLFIQKILERSHESVLEHEKVSVRIVCDRGVSHEIVRHRIASYSQESTRYCNYSKDKFGNELTFIRPCFWMDNPTAMGEWEKAMVEAEKAYFELLNLGCTPQEARSVLPNSLKTEIIVTMNLREWKHFFKLRTSSAAHPQMREIAIPILTAFQHWIPIVFDDVMAGV